MKETIVKINKTNSWFFEKIRKPSSVINTKKQRKITEQERLEISSRRLEIPRMIQGLCKDGHNKGQKE